MHYLNVFIFDVNTCIGMSTSHKKMMLCQIIKNIYGACKKIKNIYIYLYLCVSSISRLLGDASLWEKNLKWVMCAQPTELANISNIRVS